MPSVPSQTLLRLHLAGKGVSLGTQTLMNMRPVSHLVRSPQTTMHGKPHLIRPLQAMTQKASPMVVYGCVILLLIQGCTSIAADARRVRQILSCEDPHKVFGMSIRFLAAGRGDEVQQRLLARRLETLYLRSVRPILQTYGGSAWEGDDQEEE